jgi:hypothetical protein
MTVTRERYMPGDTKHDRMMWKARLILGVVAVVAAAVVFIVKHFSGS